MMDNNLNIGNKVSFSITLKKGKSYSISSRIGVITSIGEESAAIKYRGKEYTKQLSGLRLQGQKSELTEFVMSMGAGQ